MKNVKVTEFAEEKSFAPRVVRLLLASLCRSGGEPGVREKKARRGRRKGKREEVDPFPFPPHKHKLLVFNFSWDDCNTQWLCKRLGANKVYNERCANGNKFINFPFSGSLRGLKNLVLSTDTHLSISPLLVIREEERGGQGTFAVSPFAPYFSKS